MVLTELIWLAFAVLGSLCGGGCPFFFVAINIGVLFLFGYDKRAAVKRLPRIPEKELFIWMALGGSAGAMVGALLFNHKTEKRWMSTWIICIFVIHCILLAYFMWKG